MQSFKRSFEFLLLHYCITWCNLIWIILNNYLYLSLSISITIHTYIFLSLSMMQFRILILVFWISVQTCSIKFQPMQCVLWWNLMYWLSSLKNKCDWLWLTMTDICSSRDPPDLKMSIYILETKDSTVLFLSRLCL